MTYVDDCAVVLAAWLRWYGEHVEPVAEHATAATGLLINRGRYPAGRRTMPAVLAARVRAGVQGFEGSLEWGGNRVRADEAHYEIARPPEDALLAVFADRLRAGYVVSGPVLPVQAQEAS